MHYFVNIGSNLGDQRMNLSRAVRAIGTHYGYFELSHAVESAPWGFESEHRFLNIGMMFISDESPEEVLETLQNIEKELGKGETHRDSAGGYKDRMIDIDIIAADETTFNTPRLQIPHACLAERRFFLEPMAELAPLWKHPVTGLTCGQMLEKL